MTAFFTVVAVNRYVGAKALAVETCGSNAHLNQPIANGLCAASREYRVVGMEAPAIRVAFDGDLGELGMFGQDCCYRAQDLFTRGIDVLTRRLE